MANDWPQGFTSEFFSPKEFKHPELMDPQWITGVMDKLRMRCGFPIRVNNDARTPEEHAHIYRKEIAKGAAYPEDSSHLWEENHLVRASDFEPSVPRPDDGCDLSLEERELTLTYEVTRMYKDGTLRYIGLGIETGHWHLDDTPRLASKRPAFWVAVSK